MKDDVVYLRHIDECLTRIERNISVGLDEFLASTTLQDATLRNLQTMSEATQRLSPELKSAYPNVDWDDISGFRNILVHNYLGIDMELIWTIIERDVPLLKNAITEMIDNSSQGK